MKRNSGMDRRFIVYNNNRIHSATAKFVTRLDVSNKS